MINRIQKLDIMLKTFPHYSVDKIKNLYNKNPLRYWNNLIGYYDMLSLTDPRREKADIEFRNKYLQQDDDEIKAENIFNKCIEKYTII